MEFFTHVEIAEVVMPPYEAPLNTTENRIQYAQIAINKILMEAAYCSGRRVKAINIDRNWHGDEEIYTIFYEYDKPLIS